MHTGGPHQQGSRAFCWAAERASVHMGCKKCSSDRQSKFSTEMSFYFSGWAGIDKEPVSAWPEVLICFNCGFAEFTVADRELSALAQGSVSLHTRNAHDESEPAD